MASTSKPQESCCIIHFPGTKGKLYNFTSTTFSKFIQSRKAWLSFEGKQQHCVALNSYEHVDDDRTWPNTYTAGHFVYHKSCYSRFTDRSKLERAEKSMTNELPCLKKKRTRSSDGAQLVPRNPISGILPKICVICKEENLFYTCRVSLLLSSTP